MGKIVPKVNETAEFLEIASDFGNPMELFREALHNAYDGGATGFKIIITVSEIRQYMSERSMKNL